MMSSSGTGERLADAEAAALITGEDLLSRDEIPDANQQIECFSCGETMTGLFCHSCGQKNDDYRRSIWSLFSETFASVFSLENRMWRTWLMLMAKPGHVAREFSDGKRTSWTSPVRIYLALSIILFGYMSLTETRIFSVRTDIVPRAEFTGDVENLQDSSVKLSPDFGFFRRQAELDRLNAGTDFERVTRLIQGIPREVFAFEGDLTLLGDLPSNHQLKSSGSWPNTESFESKEDGVDDLRAQALDTYTQKVEDVVDTYNNVLFVVKNQDTIAHRIVEAEAAGSPLDIVDEIRFGSTERGKQYTRDSLKRIDQDLKKLGLIRSDLHRLPIKIKNGYSFSVGSTSVNGVKLSETDIQKISVKILRNPALLNEGISRYLPRIMFLMMPFAAIIGLVFIRGRKTALLYDHLVHATYIHAVTFAFLFLLIMLSQWSPLTGMIKLFFFGIAIYLPLSTKTMFRRGWFKTLFASYSIAFLYGLTMLGIVVALTWQSIVRAVEIAPV